MRIAGGSASVGPSGERGDFLRGERGIVQEVADGRIGEPRGHDAVRDVEFDLFGEAARLRVGDERHGRNFSGAMTDLAMLLEDGQDVFVERGRGCRSVSACSRCSRVERDENCEKNCAGQ